MKELKQKQGNQSGVCSNDLHEKHGISDHVIANRHVVSPFSVPGHVQRAFPNPSRPYLLRKLPSAESAIKNFCSCQILFLPSGPELSATIEKHVVSIRADLTLKSVSRHMEAQGGSGMVETIKSTLFTKQCPSTLALLGFHIIRQGSYADKLLPECGRKYLCYYFSLHSNLDRIHL